MGNDYPSEVIKEHDGLWVIPQPSLPPIGGRDSSYHVGANVNVRRGIIWGISIHNIHKGEILFSMVSKLLDVQKKKAWRFDKIWQYMC